MSGKKVFETKDLLRHIYSFGTDEHRKFTKTILDEPVCLSNVPRKYLKSKKENPEFFEKKDTIYHLLPKFYKLRQCHCCSRHTHRKPNIVLNNGRILYLTDYGARVPEDKGSADDCYCECRHRCRAIVRILQDKINYLP